VSRTVTLTQLQTDIQYQCDIIGATARHPSANQTRLINQAIQRFREKITNEGAQHYLVSTSSTLGTGPTSPYPFYVLDLSAVSPSLVRTYGIDIKIGSETRSLLHVPFQDRDQYGGGLVRGVPVAWAHYQTAKVAILPPAGSAYTYVAWYLPVFTDLSAGGDTFDGVAGWEDFIVWDVVCRIIARDTYPEAWQIAQQHKLESWNDIVRSATKVSSAGGAVIGRDSFGQRMIGRTERRRLPPP
jgi:hypothetical protein